MQRLFTSLFILALLAISFYTGTLFSTPAPSTTETGEAAPEVVKEWTCSMHPQIRQPKPGRCPLCGMDLIPVKENSGSGGNPRLLELSETARALAGIETTPVRRQPLEAQIRLTGKVTYDETRLSRITAWVPGRIERLFVDSTGIPVTEGDHLVELYSPPLIAAQEEYLQIVRSRQQLSGGLLGGSADRLMSAAYEKLILLGLSEKQIQGIREDGNPLYRITIQSPRSGIVIDRQGQEGMYLQTGSTIYTVADLNVVWLQLDAYEMDVSRLRYGQNVDFTVEARPGEEFHGTIALIDPILDEKTRTVKVRVIVDNQDGRLKPGMFARAIVKGRIDEDGLPISLNLSGHWTCSMHPEILEVKAGSCTKCGMDLIPLVDTATTHQDPLVIPATAPLYTGARAVVYVADRDAPGQFTGRLVKLGPVAADNVVVLDGLQEGEQVVSHGAFKIDSALQLLARPSMMNPEPNAEVTEMTMEPAPERISIPESAVIPLQELTASYLIISQALSMDDEPTARAELIALKGAADRLAEALDETDARSVKHLADSVLEVFSTPGIQPLRAGFDDWSRTLIFLTARFGTQAEKMIRVHCPMAFDNRGADWFQTAGDISNPYFGPAMLRCGEIVPEPDGTGGQSDEHHD